MVTLTASLASNLIAWGGACASALANPTCTLTMDASKSVNASFLDTPVVSGLPEVLRFVAQNQGSSSASQSVNLNNSGTRVLALSSITGSGDFVVSYNCSGKLAAGETCQLNVSFAPTAVGSRSGNLSVVSNAPGSPHSVALSGTGQRGVLSVSPASLSFGSSNTGAASAAQTVMLSNVGGADVNLASMMVSGEFARTTTCGPVLAQGTTCSIEVRFVPLSVGGLAGSLEITSDAQDSPQTVALSGTGVATAVVSLSPGTLSITGQAVGSSSAPRTVTLRNTGTGNLGLSSISASGDFTVTHNCGLGAGGSCSLFITFTPTATGARSGSIVVSSNLGTARVYLIGNGAFLPQAIGSISLNPVSLKVGTSAVLLANGGASGNGVTFGTTTPLVCSVVGGFVTGKAAGVCNITANQAGNAIYAAAPQITQNIAVGAGPVISFNLASLTFADQHIGTTSPAKTILLTNTGGAALNLVSILPSIPVFAVTNNCNGSLAAGGSCSLNVTFAPTATGTRLGSVTLTSNAAGSPHSVTVSGTGVASNAPICTLSAAPASVRRNGSSILTATCSPTATAYRWTGGTCAGTTASTCTVNPAATTSYSVTGTNSSGNGTATTNVTVKAVDMTPILMLLLD